MTVAGIIHLVLSCGIIWGMFIVCCAKLVKSDKQED